MAKNGNGRLCCDTPSCRKCIAVNCKTPGCAIHTDIAKIKAREPLFEESFGHIRRKYGRFASFALWGNHVDDNPLPFFMRDIHMLRRDIAVVGLNATRQMRVFQNFHHKGRGCTDKLVKAAFEGTGVYMTDIVKTDTSVNSSRVSVSEKNVRQIAKELRDVGVQTVIVFGQKAQNALARYKALLPGIRQVSCRHPAAHGEARLFLEDARKALIESGVWRVSR